MTVDQKTFLVVAELAVMDLSVIVGAVVSTNSGVAPTGPARSKATRILRCVLSGDEMWVDSIDTKVVEDLLVESPVSLKPLGPGGSLCLELVHQLKLVRVDMDHKKFMEWSRAYSSRLLQHLAENGSERAAPFRAGVKKMMAKIATEVSSYVFFAGESMDPDGALVWMKYPKDSNGTICTARAFRDGLKLDEKQI